MDPIQIVIEEYKALRAEIILCLERRITILSYGLAAIGVLVGAALNARNPTGAVIIAGLLIPIVSLFVLDIWLAETRRARRVSWYILSIELRLEKYFAGKTLRWEHEIRKLGDRGLFFEHYVSVVGFFHTVAAFSAVCAAFILFGQSESPLGPYSSCVLLATAGIVILFLGLFGRALRYANWLREEFNKEPEKHFWDVQIPLPRQPPSSPPK